MKNENEYQEKIEKLNDLIGAELDLCDSYKTPTICSNASDPESRKNLIDTLRKMCIEGGISVDEAIDKYERTFNPNMAD